MQTRMRRVMMRCLAIVWMAFTCVSMSWAATITGTDPKGDPIQPVGVTISRSVCPPTESGYGSPGGAAMIQVRIGPAQRFGLGYWSQLYGCGGISATMTLDQPERAEFFLGSDRPHGSGDLYVDPLCEIPGAEKIISWPRQRTIAHDPNMPNGFVQHWVSNYNPLPTWPSGLHALAAWASPAHLYHFDWGELRPDPELDTMLTEKPYLNVPEQTPDTIFLYRANQFVETDDGALDDCRGFFLGWEGRGDRLLTRLRPGRFTRPGFTPPAGNPEQSPPVKMRWGNINPWNDAVMSGLPAFFEPQSAGTPSGSHVSYSTHDRTLVVATLDQLYEARRASYSIIGAGFGFPLVAGKLHTIHADLCVMDGDTCQAVPEASRGPEGGVSSATIPVYAIPLPEPDEDPWLDLSATWWDKLTLEEQGAQSGDATGVEMPHPKGFLSSLKDGTDLQQLQQRVVWNLTQPANRPNLLQTQEPTIEPDPFSRVVPHAKLNVTEPGLYEVELAVNGADGESLVIDKARLISLDLDAHQPGTLAETGPLVNDDDENDPWNVIAMVNNDDDNADAIADNDRTLSPTIDAQDDDIITVVVRKFLVNQVTAGATAGSLELSASAGLRFFTEDGTQALTLPLSVDLSNPTGPLADVVQQDVVLRMEADTPQADAVLTLAYTQNGQELVRDEVHLRVTLPLDLDAHWPGTLAAPGIPVEETDENDSMKLIATVNDDDDNDDNIIDNDRSQSPAIVAEDDDILTFVVRKLTSNPGVGTAELFAGDGLRFFTADGAQELTLPLSVDLANPSGPLAEIVNADVTLRVEATIPVERTMVELIYAQNGMELGRDEIHLMVIHLSIEGGFTRGSVRYSKAMNLGGDWVVFREFGNTRPLSVLLPDPFGREAGYQYIWYRKDPRETGYTQEWKTDGQLSDPQYFADLAQQWNEILDRFNIPVPRYTADDIARQLSLKLGLSADVLQSGRYFITGPLEDTGHYQIMLLNREQDQNTAQRVCINVMNPGQLAGQFRIIGEPNAPYFKEDALINVPEGDQIFFRTLGGMRLRLEPQYATQFKAYEPYLMKYEWMISRDAQFAFPDAFFTRLATELRDEQQVPAAVIKALESALKGKTFLTQNDLDQAIMTVQNGYTITDQVLAELKPSVGDLLPSYFCGQKNKAGQICANQSGLCVLKNRSFDSWEKLVAAAKTATFQRNNDVGYHVAGYRVSKQALEYLLLEAVIRNKSLPFSVYNKLLRLEDGRTICNGDGPNACIRGEAGEGYSFRYTTAAGAYADFTAALQKALGNDYSAAYEQIIKQYADHIYLFFERDSRIKDQASHRRYLDQARGTILKYGVLGAAEPPDSQFFRDYAATSEVLADDALNDQYERTFTVTAAVVTALETAGLTEDQKKLLPSLQSLYGVTYATKEDLIAAVEGKLNSVLTQPPRDVLVARAAWRPTIYWQGKARPDIDETVTLLLTFGEQQEDGNIKLLGTAAIPRRIKSRELQLNDSGDDVKMLQAYLRQLGVSHGPKVCNLNDPNSPCKYGDCGTIVILDGIFDNNLQEAVNRLRKRDEIGETGTTDIDMLKKIQEHWTDYLAAFESYSSDSKIDAGHQDFKKWIEVGTTELARYYNDTYAAQVVQNVQPKASREKLLETWVSKEASKGHWGRQISFRIVIGECDSHGSIGFSQIQNRYKYGASSVDPAFNSVNLYHPAYGIQGFAIFSNDARPANGGGGFRRAFDGNPPEYWKDDNYLTQNKYPRIGNIYADDAKDLLSKGIMAYNRGSNLPWVKDHIWPEALRKYNTPIQGVTPRQTSEQLTRWAIYYALTVQHAANISLKSWLWTAQRIHAGADGRCDTTKANGSDDEQIMAPGTQGVPNQVCITPGENGILDTTVGLNDDGIQAVDFVYKEEEWLGGKAWHEKLHDCALLTNGCPN